MIFQPVHSINQNQRTPIVDVLRGWALLSVVLVNYTIFYSFDANIRVPDQDILSNVLKGLVQVFFQTKGWTLLALLFGYGFSVLINNIKSKGLNAPLIFGQRMFWLLVIALVNCCFYYGDVLKDYVMVGLIILIFHQATTRTFLYLAIFCFLTFPVLIPWSQKMGIHNPVKSPELSLYQSHYLFNVLWFGLKSGIHILLEFPKLFDWNLVMLTCGFFGVYLHKLSFFEKIHLNKNKCKAVFWSSLAFILSLAAFHELDDKKDLGFESYYNIEKWFLLGQMIFFSVGLCWLFAAGKMVLLFNALQTIGKMTLSNYLMQNVVSLLIFSGFGLGLMHKMPYSLHVIIGLAVFIFQVYFSRWWLNKYNYGPVEWLWRSLSAGHIISNKKQSQLIIS